MKYYFQYRREKLKEKPELAELHMRYLNDFKYLTQEEKELWQNLNRQWKKEFKEMK